MTRLFYDQGNKLNLLRLFIILLSFTIICPGQGIQVGCDTITERFFRVPGPLTKYCERFFSRSTNNSIKARYNDFNLIFCLNLL